MTTATSSHAQNFIEDAISSIQNKKIPFRTRYHNRIKVISSVDADSATDTSFEGSCDINMIVSKHMISGIPLPSIDEALYDQFVVSDDFTSLVDKLDNAKANFMTLPASLRAEFSNDVSLFASFLASADSDDLNQLKSRHGLIESARIPSVDDPPVFKPTPTFPEPELKQTVNNVSA